MSEPKPSAWLYERREDAWPSALSFVRLPEKRWTEDQALVFWTETPLYTREAIEAEIVAWLRDMLRADTNWPQVIAQKIERGEYRSKSDAHRPSDIDH